MAIYHTKDGVIIIRGETIQSRVDGAGRGWIGPVGGKGIAIRRDYERTQRAVKQETHKNKGLLLPVGQYGPTAAADRDL